MDKINSLRKKLISSTKRKIQEKYSGKDVHIIKSVNILEDLDSVSNLLIEQLREWHSVHFPELNDIVSDNEAYLKLVYQIGQREKFTEKTILTHYKNNSGAAKIAQSAKKSIGSNIQESDLQEMKLLALNCLNLLEERQYLTKYIEENMKRELVNFTILAGPIIGAKILSKAGSKKKLAFLPASAIQLIGAEKALFLHLKKGVKGPKYGYLFQHPLVSAAKPWNKGKIARSLAAKLSIAIKEDYFKGKNIAEQLKKDLQKRIKALEDIGPRQKRKK